MTNQTETKYLVSLDFQTKDSVKKFVFAENEKDAIAIFQDIVSGVNSMDRETFNHYISEAKFNVQTEEETGENYWKFAEESFETISY